MIWERLTEMAKRAPQQEAVITETDRFSYHELVKSAENVSCHLMTRGIQPLDNVALFLPNGFEYVSSFFAVVRCGGIVVPLSVNYQTRELLRYLRNSHPRILITDMARRPQLEGILDRLETPPSLVTMEDTQGFSETVSPVNVVHPNSYALRQYSTGSTGLPKPVVRTQGQLIAEVDHFVNAVKITPADRILAVVPLFHAHGLGNSLLASLMNGATMVILERFNPRVVLATLEKERITVFPGVPFMFKLLTETRPKS